MFVERGKCLAVYGNDGTWLWDIGASLDEAVADKDDETDEDEPKVGKTAHEGPSIGGGGFPRKNYK